MRLTGSANDSVRRALGGWLVALSFLLWIVLPGVPFLSTSLAQKSAIAGGFLVGAEVTFWLGLVLLGPEIAARIRSWLPGNWRRRQNVSD